MAINPLTGVSEAQGKVGPAPQPMLKPWLLCAKRLSPAPDT